MMQFLIFQFSVNIQESIHELAHLVLLRHYSNFLLIMHYYEPSWKNQPHHYLRWELFVQLQVDLIIAFASQKIKLNQFQEPLQEPIYCIQKLFLFLLCNFFIKFIQFFVMPAHFAIISIYSMHLHIYLMLQPHQPSAHTLMP